MATANNTIKTRIQLKSDVEANWNKTVNFVPYLGELIIYSAEQQTDPLPTGRSTRYSFSRLKIGDGQTDVINLPFVDAGSLNGDEEIIYKYASYSVFPLQGSNNALYLDLSTKQLYYYDPMLGYKQISMANINATSNSVKTFVSFDPGLTTLANINDHVLTIENGSLPKLLTQTTTVLTGIEIGGE